MNEIPGVLIPDEIFERLARAGSAAEQAEVGVEIAAEQVRWVAANGWSGLYLMSPSSHHPVLEVLGSGLS
jgi:5,10-methylenetetrahydrofolate reductase